MLKGSSLALVSLLSLIGVAPVRGQMNTLGGTGVVLDAGTELRVTGPITWQLQAGSNTENNGLIDLGTEAAFNEAPGAAVQGLGTERAERTFDTPFSVTEPGGLGLRISSGTALGQTIFLRGHQPATDASGEVSIARWIDVRPDNNVDVLASIDFRYDEAELNGNNEADLFLHTQIATNLWSFIPSSTLDVANNLVSASIPDTLGRYTAFSTIITGQGENALAAPGLNGFVHDGDLTVIVPNGQAVSSLRIVSATGAVLVEERVNWAEGRHHRALPALAAGAYTAQLNGTTAIRFIQP